MNAIFDPGLLNAFLNYRKELLQFLTFKVNCNETAADLCQETYLRVARISSAPEIINPRAYLFRIANNLALDHLRSRARLEKIQGGTMCEELPCAQPQPDHILDGQQQMAHLEDLIYRLPPQCRTVFLLCRVEQKSYAEIADQLGISTRTVESHMHKALKWLKSHVEN